MSQDRSAAEHVEALAALPLQHQPGEVWEYSHSTDVLGRVIEIIAERSLGEFLRERIFAPLGMADTAFYTPDSKRERLAQPYSFDLLIASNIDTIESRQPPRCEMGGGGLVSTIGDYARFLAMVSGGGAFNGGRILGSRTLAFMASDHLGPHVVKNHSLLWPGHGFGLGFAVRLESRHCADGGRRRRIFLGRHGGHRVLDFAARRVVRDPDGAGSRVSRIFPPALPQSRQRGGRLAAADLTTPRYWPSTPRARRARSASPFCSNSIEIASGVRMNAMRPSRGGRLMTTPAFCSLSQVA